MKLNLIEVFILSFSIQGVLLSLILLFKKTPTPLANRIWSFFLLLFAFSIWYNVLSWSNVNYSLFIKLAYLWLLPSSLYGPLFYFYVRSLALNNPFTYSDLFHLAPVLLVLINFFDYHLYSFGILPPDQLTANFLIPKVYFDWGLPLIILAYASYSYFNIRKVYPEDFEMLLWLKIICISFGGLGMTKLLFATFSKLSIITTPIDYAITFIFVVFVILTSYFGFLYTRIFEGKALNTVIPFIKYEKTGLTDSLFTDLQNRLTGLMEHEKIYLDNDLSLDKVANLLNVSRHHASQVINESFNQSFFQYVNKYRITEAEENLKDRDLQNLTIDEIAFKSGFNNRVSFYNLFRDYYNTTPTEFRRKHNTLKS